MPSLAICAVLQFPSLRTMCVHSALILTKSGQCPDRFKLSPAPLTFELVIDGIDGFLIPSPRLLLAVDRAVDTVGPSPLEQFSAHETFGFAGHNGHYCMVIAVTILALRSRTRPKHRIRNRRPSLKWRTAKVINKPSVFGTFRPTEI